jgi:hypothetical protein
LRLATSDPIPLKLFQIEEPDGSPVDPDAAGIAVGIDLTGAQANVAVAVGGNAALLQDREGLELDLTIPSAGATVQDWELLFEGVRLRAERALAQPVTHAVAVLAARPEAATAALLMTAMDTAGLSLLRFMARDEIAGGEAPASAAAIMAEDLAPRPTPP